MGSTEHMFWCDDAASTPRFSLIVPDFDANVEISFGRVVSIHNCRSVTDDNAHFIIIIIPQLRTHNLCTDRKKRKNVFEIDHSILFTKTYPTIFEVNSKFEWFKK